MRTTALAIIATLALSTPAFAQTSPGNAQGGSRSGTMNSTGPNDAGSGSTPGAAGSGPSKGNMSRSGTHNSTSAKDAGSGSTPGASGGSGSGR